MTGLLVTGQNASRVLSAQADIVAYLARYAFINPDSYNDQAGQTSQCAIAKPREPCKSFERL